MEDKFSAQRESELIIVAAGTNSRALMVSLIAVLNFSRSKYSKLVTDDGTNKIPPYFQLAERSKI